MASLNISDEDKRKLRSAAKSEIERLENLLKEDKNIQIVDAFKNRFNVCESAYKIILAEHQKRKGKNQTTHLKIDMRQVPPALTFAGYTFEKQLFHYIFTHSQYVRRKYKSKKEVAHTFYAQPPKT